MGLGMAEVFFGWYPVPEGRGEFIPQPDFEDQEDENGREGRDPEERFEAICVLQANRCKT